MKKSLCKRQRGSHGDGKIYENHGDRRRRLCRKPSDSLLWKKYDVWGVTHKDLDLTDEAAVFKTVENYRPDVLLHCAAISDVAECSKNRSCLMPSMCWERSTLRKPAEKQEQSS